LGQNECPFFAREPLGRRQVGPARGALVYVWDWACVRRAGTQMLVVVAVAGGESCRVSGALHLHAPAVHSMCGAVSCVPVCPSGPACFVALNLIYFLILVEIH
jgi:hypothetical protein